MPVVEISSYPLEKVVLFGILPLLNKAHYLGNVVLFLLLVHEYI